MTHFLHVNTQNQWEILDILVLFHRFLSEVRLINIQRSNRHIPTLILHRSIYLPSMSANHQELILDLPKIKQCSTTIHDLPTTIRSLIYQQQIQTQPENLVQSQPQQQQYPARPTLVQQQQKPLHVLVNDPYRQPPTPGMPMTPSGSQHSNPGTPQPNTPHNISQPGTPQPSSVPASPACFRHSASAASNSKSSAGCKPPTPVKQPSWVCSTATCSTAHLPAVQ
jgi:hypothetical protein